MLLTCLKQYTVKGYTNVIVGNLNYPDIDWFTYRCINNYVNNGMLKFVIESGFFQFVEFATRGCNLLDVILADDPLIITSVTSGPPLGNRDHVSIKFVLNVDAFTGSNNVEYNSYNWYKADFESMKSYLSAVDWHGMLYCNPSALSFWQCIVDTLWSAIAMFVPLRSNAPHCQTKRKSYPKHIRRIIAKKCRLWKRCRRCPDDLYTVVNCAMVACATSTM